MPDQIMVGVPLTNPTIQTVDGMVGEVAGLVGGKDDPEVKAKAIKLLDRAADRLNLAGVYLYRRKIVTYDQAGSGDLDLTNGDTSLTLPSDWAWPEKDAYALNSDGDAVGKLTWVGWDVYQAYALRDTTNAEGIPTLISIRNELDALAYVWPPIKTGNSDVDTLQVTYFARLLRPSEVTDSNLYATQETAEALISMGQALMMQFRHKNQPSLWIPFAKEAKEVFRQAKAAAHRNQQVLDTWAYIAEIGYEKEGEGFPTFGTVWLRI
jgi:hypothetical protein